MHDNATTAHGDYELHCTATVDDAGRYVPSIVVSRQQWPKRPRIIAVQRGTYESEATALEAARAQGIEWIKNYG